MIYDIFTYNGEEDLLEIRLNILSPYVDQFVIVEAETTFSGKPKPLYYKQQKKRFKSFSDKIRYFVINENYSREELEQAIDSPNTRGADHWKQEFLQKESIKKALTHLDEADTCYIGDVDEIWSPRTLYINSLPIKLKLDVYTYYLNTRSSEQFWGTIISPYFLVRDVCLNQLRTNAPKSNFIGGMHFTSMGGTQALRKKLTDSYTEESYATQTVLDGLESRYGIEDFLGRNFTYQIDETGWPDYMKKNRAKYSHLCK